MSHNATDMPAKISSIQTNDDVLDAVKNLCDDCQKWDKVHAATCEEFTEEQQEALKPMVRMIVICSKDNEELALYIHMRALDMMSLKKSNKLRTCYPFRSYFFSTIFGWLFQLVSELCELNVL